MNVEDAEKVLRLAHKVCVELDEIAEIHRKYENPTSKRCIRACGDAISELLHAAMLPALAEHPLLDEKIFDGRFDAKNFVVYK